MNGRLANSQSSPTPLRLLVALGLALVVLALLPAIALADTHTWMGLGDGYWSTGANWIGGVPPSDGDNLVFPSGAFGQATNDSLISDVGTIDVHGPITVASVPALAVAGGSLSGHANPAWNVATKLAAPLTISETPGAGNPPDPMTITGDITLNPSGYGNQGHPLTFNVAANGSVWHTGSITGRPVNPVNCSLTKTGGGDLRLGYGGSGASSYGGPTYVQAGSLTLWRPGALSQYTSVSISAGATLAARFSSAAVSEEWINTISGSGDLDVNGGSVSLAGDTSGLNGATTVTGSARLFVNGALGGTATASGGTLGGYGPLSVLHVNDSGTLTPGVDDYEPAQLEATDGAVLAGGGSMTVDVMDADGGPGIGFDALAVTGTGANIAVTASTSNKFTIHLRSSDLGSAGPAANFDNSQVYRWPIATTASGSVTGFDQHAFTVDASGFTNSLGGSGFTVEKSADGQSIDLVFDNTPPVITGFNLPATAGAATWSTASPKTWAVQAVDAQHDDMTLKYRVDGGSVQSADLSTQSGYADKVAFGSSALEGTHSVEVWVVDVHNAASDHQTGYFKLDSTQPTVSQSTSYLTASSSAWTKIDLATPNGPALLTASDATSGVQAIKYRIQTGTSWGAEQTYSSGTGISITDEAAHAVEFYARDVAGNESDHVTRYYNLDKTAPTVSDTSGYLTTSSTAWNKVNLPGATLVGSDALSGPASVKYRLMTDGGSWGSWITYTTPITLSDEATHQFEFYSTDNAGNDSTHVTRYYNLDKTNPVLTFGSHQAYYSATGVTFTWSATDNLALTSDLRYQYKLVAPGQTESGVPYNAENTDLTATFGSAGAPLTEGSYAFYCKVRDNAGNWDTKSFSFVVDRTAPVISGLTTPVAWTNANYVDLSWTGADNVDAPSALTYSYRVTKDGSSYIAQTSLGNTASVRLGSVSTPLPEGSYVFFVTATDRTGNTCAELSRTFGVDRTAPTVNVSAATAVARDVENSTVVSAWTASDAGAGVATETATVDGQAFAKGQRLDTLAAGSHSFSLVVTDATGNQSTVTRSFTVIAAQQPTISAPNGGEQWQYGSQHSLTFTVGNGVTAGYFRLWAVSGGGTWTEVATVAADGRTTYTLPWTVTVVPDSYQIRIRWGAQMGQWTYGDWSDGSFTVTPNYQPSVVSPNGGEQWITGSLHNVSFSVGPGVTTGYFRVWAVSNGGAWSELATQQADGSTTYTVPWTISQAPDTYQIRLRWGPTIGGWTYGDWSDGTFTILPDHHPIIVGPNGGEQVQYATRQNVTFRVGAGTTSGYFRVWAVSDGGTWYELLTQAADGRTSYTLPYTVSMPPGNYQMRMQWGLEIGAWQFGDWSDGSFVVTPNYQATIVSPNGGEQMNSGGQYTATFTVGPGAASGYYRVWVASSGGTYYEVATVPADGTTTYRLPWNVTQPPGQYRLRVLWGPTIGAWQVGDWSDAEFTIAADERPTMVAPNGGEQWKIGSDHNLTFAVGLAGTVGYYRLWAVSSGGTWYELMTQAADGRSTYSLRWNVGLPAGSYQIRIRWGSQVGQWTLGDWSDGSFGVEP